jgi:hypothetical protein
MWMNDLHCVIIMEKNKQRTWLVDKGLRPVGWLKIMKLAFWGCRLCMYVDTCHWYDPGLLTLLGASHVHLYKYVLEHLRNQPVTHIHALFAHVLM